MARFENLNQNAMSRKKRNPVHLIKQCTDNIEEYGYNYKYKSLNGYFDTFQVQIDRLVWINRSRRLLGRIDLGIYKTNEKERNLIHCDLNPCINVSQKLTLFVEVLQLLF